MGTETTLSDEDRKELLRIARGSIRAAIADHPAPSIAGQSQALKELRGVFVTLRQSNELRGCIGYIEAKLPLAQAVQEVAKKSALEDPRFPPLTSEELNTVVIEISVLSELGRVLSVEEIVLGKHGLVIDAGFSRGLLLPYVAVEHQWNREQFLRHTALKAGLPPEAWQKSGVRIYTFTTDTFADDSFVGFSASVN